ncbi:hypothetical protein E2986_12102 [Frieseomelitta varia]|uniref:Uncharacterized protein n=1 Tax=Frieseomelitta varia TaxID=561572 RepID=A0A833SDL8_9HYME|nr:hypothetical protein E2986_12102 [Frieseomelitta varia]
MKINWQDLGRFNTRKYLKRQSSGVNMTSDASQCAAINAQHLNIRSSIGHIVLPGLTQRPHTNVLDFMRSLKSLEVYILHG